MPEDAPTVCKETVIDLYDRHTREYDRDRSRSLQERTWLDRFLIHVRPGGTVLDLGCGMGEPIARYLLNLGFRVVGVDGSAAMIEFCRARFPDFEWLVVDMRQLELDRTFDGILAWDSYFHLGTDDQRGMFPRFASHAHSGAPLMFTSGPAEGEAIGVCCEEPLYHASLGPAEYEQLLATNGFVLRAHVAEDPQCGGHTVWLATYDGGARGLEHTQVQRVKAILIAYLEAHPMASDTLEGIGRFWLTAPAEHSRTQLASALEQLCAEGKIETCEKPDGQPVFRKRHAA